MVFPKSLLNDWLPPIAAHTAGYTLGAVLLSGPLSPAIAALSGAVCGATEKLTVIPRKWVDDTVDDMKEGWKQTAAKVACQLADFLARVGILMLTAGVAGVGVNLASAALLTNIGWLAADGFSWGYNQISDSEPSAGLVSV